MIALLLLAMQPTALQTEPDLRPEQAKLDMMSDACHAPRKWLRNIGGDRVAIRPAPNAKYATVDCLLAQLKRSPLKMNVGFVGNERFSDPEKK